MTGRTVVLHSKDGVAAEVVSRSGVQWRWYHAVGGCRTMRLRWSWCRTTKAADVVVERRGVGSC